MNATHTDGIEDRLFSHLLHSVFPELEHILLVVQEIILSFTSGRPFTSRARSHRLTMRTADIDAILQSHLSISLCEEERTGTFVHRWPVGIGTKTKQKLEDAGIGLRTDMSLDIRRLIGLTRPWHQSPILIVDEDAAILHRWSLFVMITLLQVQLRQMLWLGISPPFPRRNTQQSGNLEDSVCQSVVITTFYI